MDYKNYYTHKKVKELGFSEKLIKELLPEPLLEPNPHHERARPIKLWDKKVVQEAMKSKAFKDYQVSRQHRSFALKKANEIKRTAVKEEIMEILKNLTITVVSDGVLDERARRYYKWRTKGKMDWMNLAESSKEKFYVNTIRHSFTNYNDIYKKLKGKIGKDFAYQYLKEQILKLIAINYPFLEEECSRQILALRINSSENKKLILEKAREYGNNI